MVWVIFSVSLLQIKTPHIERRTGQVQNPSKHMCIQLIVAQNRPNSAQCFQLHTMLNVWLHKAASVLTDGSLLHMHAEVLAVH